jgi:anti-sigma factor (TIGR02949 family)
MDCNEARPLLNAALDRELSATEARRVEQHLDTCPDCRREAQALQALSRTTRAAQYFQAPDALRARIVAGLPGGESVGTPVQPHADQPKRRFPRLFGGAWSAWRTPRRGTPGYEPRRPASALGWPIGVAALALAAVSVTLVVHRPGSPNAPFVDDLVASHIRAQLSGHDIDVISSDQHTVKPWFNGRLDYAPPVEDLADSGFALAGGRLDYVDHRRVAVLVYRYRKHVIDVYVMPETDTGLPRAGSVLTSDGFALASWRSHGMVWWAVGDAEPAVLEQLHTALESRLDRQKASSSP